MPRISAKEFIDGMKANMKEAKREAEAIYNRPTAKFVRKMNEEAYRAMGR